MLNENRHNKTRMAHKITQKAQNMTHIMTHDNTKKAHNDTDTQCDTHRF